MAEVKWIKIVTDIFDDEKILLIESMPDADAVLCIWFKVLCLAGKVGTSGVLMLNSRIAFTDEMIATIFRRPVNTVRMSLKIFESFGMIEIVEGAITIPNWSKHQNMDAIESRQTYMRTYMQDKRAKQRLLVEETGCKPNGKPNSKPIVNRQEGEGEREGERERESISTPANKKTEKKDKYGEFGNVLLTKAEILKLDTRYGPYARNQKIEALSTHIDSKGAKYKNHYSTLLNFMRRDNVPELPKSPPPEEEHPPMTPESNRMADEALRGTFNGISQ